MFFLSEFMDADKSRKVSLDEFLNFITEKKSAGSRENLCVRIQNLRYVAYFTHLKFFYAQLNIVELLQDENLLLL